MWISAEILSNVWEEAEGENEMKEEIKETTIEMPITVLCKACKDCERLDIRVKTEKLYAGDECVATQNTLICTNLNECKMYANLVNMIITKDEEE